MTRAVLLLILGLWPLAAMGDEVLLKSGGRLSGNILEETPLRMTIEIGAGQVTLPAGRVEKVTRSRSVLAVFHERASRLSADDRAGWLELAIWARDCGLATPARRAFEQVLDLDPTNALAQQALGNVLVGDRWVSSDEAYRLRGYVLFEGTWMLPSERDQRLAEQRARLEMERLRAETEARIAEAEARAAEARAAAAREARAAEAGLVVGYDVPLWPSGRGHDGGRHCRGGAGDDIRAPERAAATPRTSARTGWGSRPQPRPRVAEARPRAATSAGISTQRARRH